jgi:hypothetical protein
MDTHNQTDDTQAHAEAGGVTRPHADPGAWSRKPHHERHSAGANATEGDRTARGGRPTVNWTDAADLALSERWFACQHYRAIGRDLNISPAAVRSRATRIGLPPRSRATLVDHFNRAIAAAAAARAGYIRRRCRVSGIWFWSTRDGPHVSPLARKSRRYAAMCGGLEEVALRDH